MADKIIFTTVKDNGDNRKLEQDENGYYKVNLGGINVFNSAGEFYTAEGINDLINNESSSFSRRLKSGYLKCEVGHPEYVPGMSKAEFYNRNMKIVLANTCAHIREVILTPTNDPSGLPGQGNYILIEGWVKPSGPHGDALKASLDNVEENTAFSIRSFTANTLKGNITIKKILEIITWDWVLEPGISTASKWKKLAIESIDVCSISVEDMMASGGELKECFNCSLESAEIKSIAKEMIQKAITSDRSTSIIMSW